MAQCGTTSYILPPIANGGPLASCYLGTCTYAKECNRTDQNSEISRFPQPTFLGSKTQQSVETYIGCQYPEHISKDREILNGNTGNNMDLPSDRGVDNIHKLQGRLLPHTNTDSIQEITCAFMSRVSPTNAKHYHLVYPQLPWNL